MIEAKESLVGKVSQTQEINGNINKEVVIIEPKLQEKEATPTEQTQIITPDTNFDGISKMTINPIPNEYVVPTGTINIGGDGTYNVKNYESAVVNTGAMNWNAIGFSSIPNWLTDGYNYAKEIYDNWDASATALNSKFYGDKRLLIFPNVDTSHATSVASMFSNCTRLQSVEMDISNATNVSSCFASCMSLRYLKLTGTTKTSSFITSNAGLSSLETADFNSLTLGSSTYNFSYTFSGCSSLKNFYINNWDTRYVQNVSGFFYGCTGLTSIDLSFMNTSSIFNTNNMFYNCTNLSFLDLRTFEFTNISNTTNMLGSSSTSGPLDNCLIIVKDNTQKTWVNTNYPRFTNVKTVEEYNAERE